MTLASIALISLLALGCNKSKQNDLQRPIENNLNSNSNASNNEDEGDVEGIDTTPLPTKQIQVGEIPVTVDVADTDIAKQHGLSGRKKLDDGTGMLFDFSSTNFKRPGFWMKDMFISIDIIWINNGKIIGIEPNVPLPPEDADLPVYYPTSEISHVLEVPAGWSMKNNIGIGTTVSL